jgi:hypothetical protein
MRAQHQRTVDRLVERFGQDPCFPALLIGGSIARGWERDDSDVDILLLATDEEYARREASGELNYFNLDLCDYPGGYVDGKIISWGFLEEVAAQGSEPARAAFKGTTTAYTRIPELAGLLARIPVYPDDAVRRERIQTFYAQMLVMQWFTGEAVKRQDRYLMTHVCADLILFGGRLILAHNRILYPYHKWFMTELRAAPEKPADLLERIDALLDAPAQQTADAFCQSIIQFTDWGVDPATWPTRFMLDTEWAWRRGKTAITDL